MNSLTSPTLPDTMTPSYNGGCDMGGFFQDKKRQGHWIVFFKGHNYRLDGHKQPIYSLKQAQKMLGYLQTEYDKDPKRFDHQCYGRDKRMLVENAWETYMAESPCGLARMRQRQQIFETYILPTFGKMYVKDIHFVDLKSWVKGLKGKPSYVKNIVSTFRHFFRFWFMTETIDRIPGFPMIEVQPKDIKWLTQEQQAQVHEFIPPQHLPVFKFLQGYGKRPSEVCNIKREDIDWMKKEVRIHNTKRNRIRPMPIGEWFESYLKNSPKVSNQVYVFSTETGKPYTRQILYNIWIRASKKANNNYGTPVISNYEGNRKSWGSQRWGLFDPALISDGLDHANVSTTQKFYAGMETKKLGEVVEMGRK